MTTLWPVSDYTLKKMCLYGQLVEVKVYPPKKTPDPSLSANPMGRLSSSCVDSTVYETARPGASYTKKRSKPSGRKPQDKD